MRILNKRALAVVEYIVLLVVVILAFLVMRNYVQRGIFGLWAQSGKSLAYGRQYDPQKTVECAYNDQKNLWYDRNCFLSTGGSCQTSSCNQLDQ